MRKLIVAIALVLIVVPVAAQKWTPPRTPWGDPDLQGLWPSWQLLSVPLERPLELGTKAMLADEEFARLPARSRLPGRGRIAEGLAADVVVFDPARIADVATLTGPYRGAVGIAHVFVNGVEVVTHGVASPERTGRVLRRGSP